MPAVNVPGALVRIARKNSDGALLPEEGWKVISTETVPGMAVVGKETSRVSVPISELEALNFEGSDSVVQILNRLGDTVALNAFAEHNLVRVRSLLLSEAQKMDPSFRSIQTVSDFLEKIKTKREEVEAKIKIVISCRERAHREYDAACRNGSADQKDCMLVKVQDTECRYRTLAHIKEALQPEWEGMAAALTALNTQLERTKTA